MTEEERTVEATANETEQSRGSTEYDEAAAAFLELEAELDTDGRALGTTDECGRRCGLVVDGERVEAAAVPVDYPTDVGTDRALALTVDTGSGETSVYFEWPGEADGETRLSVLLDAMDIEIGALYGREVLLERVDGHDVVVTPSERPRGSGPWGLGVAGGHVLNAAFLGLFGLAGAVGLSLPVLPLVGCWLLVSSVWLPYATYRDGWYLRTHSDWDEGPLFWATAVAVPVANLLAGVAYLRRRARATFFGDEPSLRARAAGAVRSLLSSF